ncbi:MAG: complex I NDUFA9 subunit family protein [Gammaproteobacteria bacterium]|nr:complex I NDUFA9 subunit family protein [Gammaproteobacteria bacterium]NIR88842.1 complex I NDUFA9 subunit family protein [Gammaproteobacteria bacterium]NIU06446.1 complex I NDUFA9 subunit family protein [Gammaproteobacteria bacterium]NIV53338.1 NAD-dependent epimerase/dehydratase family protein [Gammaproteobacteria bacterium]NIV74057.1 NAD-dependent epimerase/dehydratase family protein [Gammaproteobacteria bacterium]
MTVVVFGGTGFLGSRIVARLVEGGQTVRAAVRHPQRVGHAQAEAVHADVREESSVTAALRGAGAAVNVVGLYVEQGAATFDAVHVAGAARIARCARAAGTERLVHISGIGADPESPSAYVRARGAGEAAVREAFPEAVILRPSVLFGPGDAFLSVFDDMTRRAPAFPLFGSGQTRLQPVFVDDVAEAVARALEDPAASGRTLELGGPDVWRFRDIVEGVLRYRRRRRLLLPLPFAAWDALAAGLALLPSPPLTRDQVALMRENNVVDPERDGFAALGVRPRGLEELLPQCLDGASKQT